MKAVHVRDVPEEVLAALKRRAERNHRSLQMELRAILFAAAERAPPAAPLPTLNLRMSRVRTKAGWSREEIYGDDAR